MNSVQKFKRGSFNPEPPPIYDSVGEQSLKMVLSSVPLFFTTLSIYYQSHQPYNAWSEYISFNQKQTQHIMMVDGETIARLRHDLDVATAEIAKLKLALADLKEKTKILETLHGEKLQSLIELLERGK